MEKRSLSKDPLIGFGISEQVATFLLHEAFRFVYEAAVYEVAGELFAERIESIDPEPGWKLPEIPEGLTDWLASRTEIDGELLDPITTARLAEAWRLSQQDAYSCGRKIPKTQKLQSLTDVVGHVSDQPASVSSSRIWQTRQRTLLDAGPNRSLAESFVLLQRGDSPEEATY